MMKTSVNVRIMDNDFQLQCNTEERAVLEKSAATLNQHLKDFRLSNPSMDMDKAIIMGALRATCELVANLDKLSDHADVANGEMKKALSRLS